MEPDQPHGQFLRLHHVHLEEIAHQDPGDHDPQQQEEREIVGDQRDVANLRIREPSKEEIAQRRQDDQAGQVYDRRTHLEEPVQDLHQGHEEHDRLGEEAEVAQQDHEKTVVERNRTQPEKEVRAVYDPLAPGRLLITDQRNTRVPEERTKRENLQRHSRCRPEAVRGVFKRAGLDPGERFLLAARRRDPEGNRNGGPFQHPVDNPDEEHRDRCVRDNHPEHNLETCRRHAKEGEQHQDDNRDESVQGIHLPTPRLG